MKFLLKTLPIVVSLLIGTYNHTCYASNEIVLNCNCIDHIATNVYRISNCTSLANITNEEKQRYKILNTWLNYDQLLSDCRAIQHIPNTITIGELLVLMRVCINDAKNIINDYLDLQNSNSNVLRNRQIAKTIGWILEELNSPIKDLHCGNLFDECIILMSLFVNAINRNNLSDMNLIERKLNNINNFAHNYINITIYDIRQNNINKDNNNANNNKPN